VFGLKMFIVDPLGADLARTLNASYQAPVGAKSSELEAVFESSVIGASRRALSQIFNDDQIEHAKVIRFLG
jgi:hypothetical protein